MARSISPVLRTLTGLTSIRVALAAFLHVVTGFLAFLVAVVLLSLATGIAFTIGTVALLAIAGRRLLGQALAQRMSGFERGARILQGATGLVVFIAAAYALWAYV